MSNGFEGILDDYFKSRDATAGDEHYKDGLRKGYAMGFNAARDRIAMMLEEEGKGQTAAKLRKLQLVKK